MVDVERCPTCHRELGPEDERIVSVKVARGRRALGWLLVAAWCVVGGLYMLGEFALWIGRSH
jgi:hypothetical protein